jgi:hypothetical protein
MKGRERTAATATLQQVEDDTTVGKEDAGWVDCQCLQQSALDNQEHVMIANPPGLTSDGQ